MNKITQAFLTMAATVALVSCAGKSTTATQADSSSDVVLSSSSAATSSVASSSSTELSSSSLGASSSSFVYVVVSSSSVAGSSSSVTAVSSSSVAAVSSSSVIASSASSFNPFNPNISYGVMNDPRDGQAYKTVVIGSQTWMAQNLNYKPTSGNSWCYSNTASNCTTYGRLYDYPTALTACPTGWHLPNTTAWNTLEAYVGGAATAGTALKANSTLWSTNIGTDAYGFSALPGGLYNGTAFYNVGDYGEWWTATTGGNSIAYNRYMFYSSADVNLTNDCFMSNGFSARCLKD